LRASVDAGLVAVERGGGTLEAGSGLLSTPPSSSSNETTVAAGERHGRGVQMRRSVTKSSRRSATSWLSDADKLCALMHDDRPARLP